MDTKKIINCQTGEVTDVELSAEDIQAIERAASNLEQHRINIENNAQAKTALLEQLGITEEQAKLLLS